MLRLLDALAGQTFPAAQMEVIVVADGCVDGTKALVESYRAPFPLTLLEQSGQGAATARNYGATVAKAPLLIFLDDDIEPRPKLVAAHVNAHQAHAGGSHAGRVVLGYLPPVLTSQSPFFRNELKKWWEAMFQRMRAVGYRYSYYDLLSGNFSLAASLFASVGGFEPSLRSCFDDFELGVRLLKAGAEFFFAEEACGYHHEARTLEGLLKRKQQEGRAEIILGRRHPELIPMLLVSKIPLHLNRYFWILNTVAFRCSLFGDIAAHGLQQLLPMMERAQAYHLWQRNLERLLIYWHWRGLAKELGTPKAFFAFLAQGTGQPNGAGVEVDIDLSRGVDVAERTLDETRPSKVNIYYKEELLGYIPAMPGAEPLHSKHLRPYLSTNLADPLIKILQTHERPDWLAVD